LPYHGLGSGIKRVLDEWPQIDFTDDRDGCLFTATVHRKGWKSAVDVEAIGSEKSSEKILRLLKNIGEDGGCKFIVIPAWFCRESSFDPGFPLRSIAGMTELGDR
jgi:hypothetical protein